MHNEPPANEQNYPFVASSLHFKKRKVIYARYLIISLVLPTCCLRFQVCMTYKNPFWGPNSPYSVGGAFAPPPPPPPAPLTKKLNNLKTVQALAAKLKRIFLNFIWEHF